MLRKSDEQNIVLMKRKHLFIITSCFLMFFSASIFAQEVNQQSIHYTSSHFINPIPFDGNKEIDYKYFVFEMKNGTFGYEIIADEVVILKQMEYPGKGEGNGFETGKDAEVVAKMVIAKLRNPVMPPVLDSNHIEKLLLLHNQ